MLSSQLTAIAAATGSAYIESIIDVVYIIAAVMFIAGLKMLSSPTTARKGNIISAVGMAIAVIATCFYSGLPMIYVLIGILFGSAIGAIAANMVPMTQMPEMVAIFNGVGGLSSLLIGWGTFYGSNASLSSFTTATIILAVLIGGVAFTGSVVAYLKLAEKINGKPVLFNGQHIVNAALIGATVIFGVIISAKPGAPVMQSLLLIVVALSLVVGVMAVIPIGGADMPVVISLMNSYSGLAAAAAGFVIHNNLLIVAGSLVGASGIILTQLMCKAMNRSLSNVLFSGFGAAPKASAAAGADVKKEAIIIKPQDAYFVMEAAQSVVFVPGYGMAVAQAQHAVRELAEILEKKGADVKFAIHPVAGRMPGHMNVLLAEANIPYDKLVEMDDINPIMETVDLCVVLGANDVVNPSAREDRNSLIYGMPIINVDYARQVFVLKRSMNAGFAGIDNPLFYKDNTSMVLGDAKATIEAFVSEFKKA
ncbi:MAG: NAD(P)(+) transhydrogenase (Re/Si-specific) subunit beta [Planctomycetota bacterium]